MRVGGVLAPPRDGRSNIHKARSRPARYLTWAAPSRLALTNMDSLLPSSSSLFPPSQTKKINQKHQWPVCHGTLRRAWASCAPSSCHTCRSRHWSFEEPRGPFRLMHVSSLGVFHSPHPPGSPAEEGELAPLFRRNKFNAFMRNRLGFFFRDLSSLPWLLPLDCCSSSEVMGSMGGIGGTR